MCTYIVHTLYDVYTYIYLEVKVPGAEYSSCAIYFWAVPGKSTWRNSPYFSEHTCAIYFHAKGANTYLVFGGHR